MTSLVRRFLKTAIAFLLAGLAIGFWMMLRRELANQLASPFVLSAHTHAILVGFVMMMILGVAQWMFPRPARDDVRYDPRLAELSYWLLATGTVMRVIGELMRAGSDAMWLRIAVLVAGGMQVAGLVTFFANMWTRIRGTGSVAREASGERF